MSLARLEKVTKTFEPYLILDAVSWQIAADERVGLVGANGTGKTTCLEILAGIQEPTTGQVIRARGLKLGYLRQEENFEEDIPLREAMLRVFAEQRRLEEQMHALSEQMGEADDEALLETVLEKYDRLEHLHQTQGGYGYEYRIDSILAGLGFAPEDFAKPTAILSGGQRSRAALAKLLLEEPDLLLLDEPTNHLDIRAVEWLESFLNVEYRGAYVVVSHDRYFLDKVTKKTVELRNHRLTEYRGNYSQYVKTRERDLLTQQRAYEQQQEYIAKSEDYIRRNIAGQNTRQAQGLRKRLERLERIEKPQSDANRMRLRLDAAQRSGEVVLTATNLAKDYGDGPLFEALNFEVNRKDTLGIMGPNGAGKTTLFRILLGEETPTEGQARLGASLNIGYLSQDHDGLSDDRTIMEEIRSLLPYGATQGEVRSVLAPFLFRGDDVDKRIGVLSGGERARVSLCKLLLQKANLLLLDEPTNHLDIPSRESLEAALLAYPATMLVISHDRYLLSKLATKLLIFEEEGVRFWKYSYAEWVEWKQEQEKRQKLEKAEATGKGKTARSLAAAKTAHDKAKQHAKSKKNNKKKGKA